MVLWSARFFGSPESNRQRIHLSHIQNMHEDCEKERGEKNTTSQTDSVGPFIYCQMSSAFGRVEEVRSFMLKIFSLLWGFAHLIPSLE